MSLTLCNGISLLLNYFNLGHANFKNIANFQSLYCVITVNRYNDNKAQQCENYRNYIVDLPLINECNFLKCQE